MAFRGRHGGFRCERFQGAARASRGGRCGERVLPSAQGHTDAWWPCSSRVAGVSKLLIEDTLEGKKFCHK